MARDGVQDDFGAPIQDGRTHLDGPHRSDHGPTPSSIAALTEDLCALVTDNRIAIVIATESASANAGDDAMLVDDRMSTFTSIADARRWLHVREA